MTAQVAADLLTTAALIRTEGWEQHCYLAPTNGRDISGALAYVASDARVSMPELLTPDEYIRWHTANGYIRRVTGLASIDAFNDAPDMTLERVLSALEAAAALAERSAA